MLRIMQAGTLEPFTELAAVIGLAAALGMVGSLLRQPLLMAFIGAGILAGPDVLGLLSMDHEVRLLASVGICVLLFVVGLRLDLNIIRSMGPAAAVLGLGQVVATALLGFGVCLALGFTLAPSQIYAWIGVVFAAVMLGGLGRALAPLIAGIVIGVSEAVTMAVTAPSWAPLVSFALLIAILLFRPGRAS